MQIKRLILQTSRLEELTNFYMQLMELPVELSGDKQMTARIGSTELVFQQAPAADPFYHFAINIPANKIEEARIWLKERVELIWMEQYSSDIADFVDWHAKSVYFYDAAGNILELIARFDLDNKTVETFSSRQFLCISEIGFVFRQDDLEINTRNLMERYHFSYFEKQSPLPQFKAIGDDDGLLIVVPEHRNWFPTTIPSGIFPIKLEFESRGTEYALTL